MQTATNPQTGERVVLINGQWLPFTQSATDDKGQKAFLSNGQWIVAPAMAQPPQEPESFSTLRQIADVPLGIAKGAVQGVRMIADAFGAGSDTSKTIKSAETYLADLMSAQAKNDQQEIARIMKDAEDKGVLNQVKAGIKAFTVAPIDTLSSALGTAAPVIAGALGAKILGAGALVSTGVSALTGAGMGAGTIKGSIYEETKKTLKEAGASEQDAEARAQLAQQYNGKNLDQILLGTVLGGAAAVGPLEKGGAAILARRILGKTGTEATETVATEAAKGAVRRRLEAGALEALPEAVQAGQEQVATNIALQREGFDVPTFRGAVSSATLEGLAGAGLGAAVGGGRPAVAPEAEPAPPVAPPPAAPEAELEQLTPQQKQELERQRALRERPQTTEELLAGITPAPTTTPLDVARIRDEHETAVIEGLLAQDAEMKLANDFARKQLELESEAEATAGGISDVDRRVREGRIFARVQDLIDRNIPFASTAINDINQKFGVINEAPLTEEERARVENIMGMVSTFTNFVNLPVLAPKLVDPFAENQQMEALIRERTERGQAQPVRTAPAAPSPSFQETPVSQGVGEGAAVRPAGGVEPSVAQDRQLVTPAPVAPAAPPAPFTAPGGFVSSLTLSPAYEGIEPLSVEDADFELEALQNSAEKGRLTPEQFAGSEIGKRLDTAQIAFINEGLRTDPVGTITALRDRLKQATDAPAAPKAEASAPETPASETQAEPLGTRKEAQAFGKAIGATQPYPGELRGRVNLPAQKAAKEGNFQGVLSALEKSKNVIVAEIAKRARALGTKIVIDDNAEETYTGPSTLMRQMSIDGAKMHLEALNKIRALAPQVDALPDKAPLNWLGFTIRNEKIKAFDNGKEAGNVRLEDIAKMGHSMFAPLSTGPFEIKTKEDFKRLQKAYEDLTSEYGENALQLTSTGSAQITGIAGQYDYDTDTILVPEYNSKREEVLAHEIVHAQVAKDIASPSLRQKPIVARLNKLYEHVKKELEGRPGRAPYGIQSIQEFVAEGMGNPAFQFLLKKIKYENTSAWDSFVQTIANLIGVKRDTAFTELLSIYSDLTTEQKAAPKAPAVKAPAPKAEAPAAEAPTAEPTTLTTQIGGSDTKLDLGKPVWQATDDDLVQAVKDSGAYLGKPGSKYDPYMAWREAHNKAIQQAKREGKPFPAEVLYDKPRLIRDDLSDSQADEAIDAMVSVYRATKDYGKAVEAYRNFGKKPAAEAPAAPAAPKQPAFVYRTAKGDQTQMRMFTEDETVEFNNIAGQPQLVIRGKNIAGTGDDTVIVYHNNIDRRSNVYDAKDLQKLLDVDPKMVKAIQKWLASDASTITSNGQELAKTLSDFVEGSAAEAPAAPTPFMQRLQEYWGGTVTPAIRNYLDAFNSFGVDRLESSQIKPAGMSAREWVESFVSKQSTWDKGRKTGVTGIQALSTKNLWPTTDGSGERLRKAMLEAVKALKNAPGSTSELMDQAFTEERKSLGSAQAQRSNFEQTLRTLLNKFGLKDVGLSIIEGMQDAGSYAQQLIRIADRADNPIRTLRHEAIHALRELGFFTDAQWKSLSKMAKDKWIDQYLKQRNVDGKPLKAGEESRYDAYMREYNGDMEKITEEAVADAFADFDASKPPAGLLQALLKRMKDLFQSIKSALTKVESADQIFGKVEEGKLKPGEKAEAGERKSVRDRATANFLRWFGDSKVVNEKGEPLVVYHGSKSDITEFDPSKGAAGNQGMFFTTDIDLANVYGKDGAVYPVYVSIKNPLILQGNERFAPQGIKGKLAKLLFPAKYTKAEREQRIKDMLFDGNAGRIFSKQDVELLRREGYDGVVTMNAYPEGSNLQVIVAFEPTQIKSAIGNNGDYSLTNADIRKSIGGVSPGQKALETIRSMGMDVPKPDPTKLEKAKDIWTKAKEDPKLTAQSAAKVARDFLDKVETWSFSSDAKLNNDYRRAIISDIKQNEGVIGQLLEMSQSQAVHADALASQFMIEGGLKYNDELKKWESFDAKANFPELSKKLDEIGKKYNLSKEQIERVAHTYLVSKRLPGLIERNRQLDEEIAAEQATSKPDKKKIQDLEDKKVFISDKQLEQMEPGLSLGKTIPELNQVVNMWNDIRKNTIDVMVNSGLWSPEYAQAMWDNMDYVPYFREDQIENEKGPQEFIRGLQVKSKEFQLKGSEDAVHDVFDNMIRWTQYAINRSVRAHKALQMIDNSKDIKVGDRKMAEKVTEEKRGMNIVRVFRDGKQELYDMADPLYVQAFAGIQNVSIPTLKFMSKISDILRNSVVLYPLFSVAQVPQDSFAAMFTSGLKTQHALKIPYLAVKEFVKTLAKTSQTHEVLKKFGATGVRDFSATVIRDDAEIYAGLKPPRGGWGKTKEFLSHISMAADNAVRQAVYEASIQQGVSRSEAIEKAFEVINFRRKGTSKMLNILGQTVPFFYAYLSAQRVAYKVLTGVGISPTDRAEAGKTLAVTSAAVATLSMLYAMANGDDEDYMETPANIRDRTLTIPGSGGVRIPLRPDFFLFPKIIAEHTYLLLAEKGYQDAAKFRTSMKDALFSAIASPTPFPTAIKPAIEVAINYDFFQGKPLIGNFEKQKDIERQFRDSTSELAKLFGQTGLISPIAADHMIRGMLGSFGGLVLFGTNQFLHSDPDVPRPELSAKEMLAALPGTSGLLKRPQESALKNDFYVLRDEVEKAANTFSDIKNRSPEGIQAFLEDEKNMARLGLAKGVDKINRELSKIRKVMTQITNMPESQMSGDEKSENIRQLRELEREILRSVNVKELREMAKI